MIKARKFKKDKTCKTCPNNIFDRNENAQFCLPCTKIKAKLVNISYDHMRRNGFIPHKIMLKHGELFKRYGIKVITEEK